MQATIPSMTQAWTELEAPELPHGHAEIGIPVGINGQPFNGGARGLPHRAFKGGARLALMSPERLVVDNPPLIQYMRVETHRVGSPPRVHPSIPQMP
jgi:hypothetical protein